jgi:hypothetical protein
MRPRLLAPLVAGLVAASSPARADAPRSSSPPDETQACIDASDHGQTLRIDKHLRAARDQFAVCARRACPGEIRSRCAAWLDETERAIPAVVFVVKDLSGADVAPVRIAVDGAVVSARYDGSALAFDPGEHVFRFDAEGKAGVTKTLRLAQGEQDRRETIVLAAASEGGSDVAEAPSSSGLRTAAWVIASAGVAGVVAGSVLGVLAIADNDDAHCTPANVCTDPQARRDAQRMALGSTVGFVAGGALLAGGILLFVLAPRSTSKTAAFHVEPAVASNGAGVVFGGAW